MLSERRAGELRTVSHFVYGFAGIYDQFFWCFRGLLGLISEIYQNLFHLQHFQPIYKADSAT